jgi:tRNA(adenine34) deaminase
MMHNNVFMQAALDEAAIAFAENEVPVGAVIVNRATKQILSRGHNIVEQKHNPLLHAEIIAINQACTVTGSKNLSEYDIYVTLEPCNMCSSAISFAKLGNLFYGASDTKHGAVENNTRFFTSASCFHRPEIYPGLYYELSASIMKKFFRKIRSNSL